MLKIESSEKLKTFSQMEIMEIGVIKESPHDEHLGVHVIKVGGDCVRRMRSRSKGSNWTAISRCPIKVEPLADGSKLTYEAP